MKKILTIPVFAVLMIFMMSFQSDNGDSLLGIWEPSNGRARVKIEKIGNKYYGKIVWLI